MITQLQKLHYMKALRSLAEPFSGRRFTACLIKRPSQSILSSPTSPSTALAFPLDSFSSISMIHLNKADFNIARPCPLVSPETTRRPFSTSASAPADISASDYSILVYPHPKLRQPNAAVMSFDASLRNKAALLTELMMKHDGVGLAAPQVGLNVKMLVFPREILEDYSEDNSDDAADGSSSDQIDSRNNDSNTTSTPSSTSASPSSPTNDIVVMCNPVVLKSSWSFNVCEEGCLSFPDINVDITRPDAVFVRYQDLEGDFHEIYLTELGARVFQHEFDHLNGMLFIDHFTDEDKRTHGRSLEKLVKDFGAGAAR